MELRGWIKLIILFYWLFKISCLRNNMLLGNLLLMIFVFFFIESIEIFRFLLCKNFDISLIILVLFIIIFGVGIFKIFGNGLIIFILEERVYL